MSTYADNPRVNCSRFGNLWAMFEAKALTPSSDISLHLAGLAKINSVKGH